VNCRWNDSINSAKRCLISKAAKTWPRGCVNTRSLTHNVIQAADRVFVAPSRVLTVAIRL